MNKYEEIYSKLKSLNQKELKEIIGENESLLVYNDEKHKIKLFNIDKRINIVIYHYSNMSRDDAVKNILSVYQK